jgi:nucleoside-diphosphate-sugar epimerase
MRILVTGSAGKLGQWVVRELKSHNHHVTAFDRVHTTVAADRVLMGDIEDLNAVAAAVEGAGAVLHLAGIPTHGLVSDDETFRINVMGSFNVHQAARLGGVPRVVSMSSEAVLGWAPGSWQREHLPDYLPIDEDHPCRPQDCYGLSKLAMEAVGRSFTDRCGMVTIFIRAPWIIAPEELDQLTRNNGRPVKDFGLYHYIDARDLAEACRLAVEVDLAGSQALFVGSGETTVSISLAELYPKLAPAIGERAAKLTGRRGPVSIERARHVLGWSPKRSWRLGIGVPAGSGTEPASVAQEMS